MVAEENRMKCRTVSDLEHARIAVPVGTVIDEQIRNRLPNARIEYFATVMDCILAVKNGQVEGFAYDEPVLRYISAHTPDLFLIKEKLTVDDYGIAVNLDRTDLKEAIDDAVAELKENGMLEQMINRWFPETGALGVMPNIEPDGQKGTLKMGIASGDRPFSFIVGDETLTGFEVELARRICLKLEMRLEFVDMKFSELIQALTAKKVDAILSAITITDERAKSILFSKPYFQGGVAVIVKR